MKQTLKVKLESRDQRLPATKHATDCSGLRAACGGQPGVATASAAASHRLDHSRRYTPHSVGCTAL